MSPTLNLTTSDAAAQFRPVSPSTLGSRYCSWHRCIYQLWVKLPTAARTKDSRQTSHQSHSWRLKSTRRCRRRTRSRGKALSTAHRLQMTARARASRWFVISTTSLISNHSGRPLQGQKRMASADEILERFGVRHCYEHPNSRVETSDARSARVPTSTC